MVLLTQTECIQSDLFYTLALIFTCYMVGQSTSAEHDYIVFWCYFFHAGWWIVCDSVCRFEEVQSCWWAVRRGLWLCCKCNAHRVVVDASNEVTIVAETSQSKHAAAFLGM